MRTQKIFSITLIIFVLTGSGCISQTISKTSDEINLVTDSLLLKPNSTITIKQTVLGLEGLIVDLFGGQSADRMVTITDWLAGNRVSLKWNQQIQIETKSSLDARKAYDFKYKETSIGTKIPSKPKQIFETITQNGVVGSNELVHARTVFLPALWPEGDAGVKAGKTLLWISTDQYDELVKIRKTVLNLGLFDDSIASTVAISDNLHNFINSLKKNSAAVKDRDELLSIFADEDWGTFQLNVNGKPEVVKTIEAHNWFGRYTILANRDNPLILEVSLSPAAKGSLNIFSRQNFLDAFAGYRVTEIDNDK